MAEPREAVGVEWKEDEQVAAHWVNDDIDFVPTTRADLARG